MNRTVGRRYRERWCPKGLKVAWSSHWGQPLHPGRVMDISESGIALDVDGGVAPYPGSTIRMMARGDTVHRKSRVVRVTVTPSGRVVLGCHWIHGSGAGLWSRRPRHAERRGTRLIPGQVRGEPR